MPPKGYRHLSLRTELYEKLEQYARAHSLATTGDAIAHLLEQADCCQRLERLEHRLKELEATCRKTYLALLRLIEELAAGSGEEEGVGPESPAGGTEGVMSEGTSGAVKSALAADPVKPLRRGREPPRRHQDQDPANKRNAGPESPAGGAVKEGREDESAPRRTVTRPLDADRSAPEPLRQGREPPERNTQTHTPT